MLHHPEGVVWRSTPAVATESWHPMAHLLGRPSRIVRASHVA